MSLIQDFSKQKCRVLAVLCGKIADRQTKVPKHQPKYPFPEISSSGRLEVQILSSPTPDKFGEAHKLFEPNILYFQGEQLEDEDEIGGLVWGTLDVSDPHMFSSLVAPSLSTTVYLEVPNGENIAQMLHSKGVPYVIYWKNSFSYRAASHFRQALLSVIQSSCSHTWDAFQLAHASFRLYCTRNNHVLPVNSQKVSGKVGPRLLGDSPNIDIAPPEKAPGEEENASDTLPAVKVHDDDVDVRFLVCGEPCTLDACLLGSLEDGLGALLNIEIRGSKLHNRVSAAPPPLQAGSFSHGVVTMRCDLTTCSSAHVSLLVSGSAQTCFDDQLLECHIKNELIEKSQLVHALPSCEESKRPLLEPLNSICIACGASVFEVCMKVPTWAAQVLKHLAPETSYRSLVTLGIASVHGIPVASFEKDDAMRLLFFCKRREKDTSKNHSLLFAPPTWSSPVSRKRNRPGLETESGNCSNMVENGVAWPKFSVGHRLKVAAMRPIPHSRQHRILSFSGTPETDAYAGSQLKPIIPIAPPVKHNFAPHTPPTRRKSMSRTSHTQQIISLNPLPMKKHGCNRSPIRLCSEEEFLRDVMQFLILRGHSRLVPQGGISEFPDAILNTKRLDLYNLYREVVSRGGFYVGNGINWKGQVFSKMHNHTVTHRMTGVGNTLKRHYETYLLEYELAHDDVDGECCLLCHSSAPGDWVNCGLCGEWAHFGCDRRQGLGAFKDYAKTDGLEYICPHCSLKNYKRKSQKMVNGITHASTISRQV